MRRSLVPRLPVLAGALLACGAALALERADFAWQWPLDTGGHEGLLALTLTPPVYERVTRADLRDLAVFNGAGEPVPFGPSTPPEQRAQALQPPPVPVPLFALDEAAARSGDAVSLRITRDSDGRLRALDADVSPDAPAAARELLLDLSALERPVHGLALTLDPAAASLDARVTVEGSEDLGRWQRLADGLAVVRLEQDGFRLERTRLSFPATRLPYLRLRRSDAQAPLPLTAVAAVPAPVEAGLLVPARSWLALPGTAVAGPEGEGGSAFAFRSSGPFPVTALDVELADSNAIADVVVSSRDADDQPWRERARFTAFRLGGNGEGAGNAEVETGLVRDRQWRVLATPAQPRPPQLRLGWRPDRFLLLTQGEPPFLLAAGSASGLRAEYPLTVALAELQARNGQGWQPPQATPGGGAPLSGEAALSPSRELPVRQLLLWTVLVGGALILVGMVLRLLRQPQA
jgi:hypothetical protein